jgi:hypothetical protein
LRCCCSFSLILLINPLMLGILTEGLFKQTT